MYPRVGITIDPRRTANIGQKAVIVIFKDDRLVGRKQKARASQQGTTFTQGFETFELH